MLTGFCWIALIWGATSLDAERWRSASPTNLSSAQRSSLAEQKFRALFGSYNRLVAKLSAIHADIGQILLRITNDRVTKDLAACMESDVAGELSTKVQITAVCQMVREEDLSLFEEMLSGRSLSFAKTIHEFLKSDGFTTNRYAATHSADQVLGFFSKDALEGGETAAGATASHPVSWITALSKDISLLELLHYYSCINKEFKYEHYNVFERWVRYAKESGGSDLVEQRMLARILDTYDTIDQILHDTTYVLYSLRLMLAQLSLVGLLRRSSSRERTALGLDRFDLAEFVKSYTSIYCAMRHYHLRIRDGILDCTSRAGFDKANGGLPGGSILMLRLLRHPENGRLQYIEDLAVKKNAAAQKSECWGRWLVLFDQAQAHHRYTAFEWLNTAIYNAELQNTDGEFPTVIC